MTTATTASIFDLLPFAATRDQARALYQVQAFLDGDAPADCFILRGCAGTGKTSMLKAVVDYLAQQQMPHFLMAPTGRAAKVLSQKTNMLASTVHHVIYTPTEDPNTGTVIMRKRANDSTAVTVFVVDEASMISDQRQADGDFQTPNSLLFDLLDFVKQGNARSKVIFVGDSYQLAPVSGEGFSPALDADYLCRQYKLRVQTEELREVMRQVGDSPVLRLATDVRERSDRNMALDYGCIPAHTYFTMALKYYLSRFDANQPQRIGMIASSNKDVHFWNNCVRERLGLSGKLLSEGDLVVLHESHFARERILVKGEMAVVKAVSDSVEQRAGFHFMDAELEFTDAEGQRFLVSTKVMLDTLPTEKGFIDREAFKTLKHDRMAKNTVYRDSQRSSDDPYMGALRLRYGYALTCHKAQGGEWQEVIIHPYFQPTDYRYLYTAVTRARERVMTWNKK